jgi:hypothetical protein
MSIFSQIPPRFYRAIKIMHLVISFLVFVAAFFLIRGWPIDSTIEFWGEPLRTWGYGLAIAALISALSVLIRSLIRPGYKPDWWG